MRCLWQEDYDAVAANLGMGSLPDEADETGLASRAPARAAAAAKLFFTFFNRTGDTALLADAETGNTAIAEVRALAYGNPTRVNFRASAFACVRALPEPHP